MKKDNAYKNIYLVTVILSVFVLFSIISFIFIDKKINSGSSAQIYEKTLLKK